MITIANANALHIPLADQSVQCVVTSPPYWGLRDYGTAKWEGGSTECDHVVGNQVQDNKAPGAISSGVRPGVDASVCKKCGARRIDAQIGLESTPAAYVSHIVSVMRECWRVLKDDGTLWLNLGDSYTASGGGGHKYWHANPGISQSAYRDGVPHQSVDGLKPKDLCGIPWRVAFALQEDGAADVKAMRTLEQVMYELTREYDNELPDKVINVLERLQAEYREAKQGSWYLRSDIIWSKPNPMPESVTDRPTKAHEYVFLLTKQARYYYDAEAIKETLSINTIEDRKHRRSGTIKGSRKTDSKYIEDGHMRNDMGAPCGENGNSRNRRSVWTVATQPYSGAHFATFPPALIEPMILAGTSARGECPHCGKAWVRVVEKESSAPDRLSNRVGYKSPKDIEMGEMLRADKRPLRDAGKYITSNTIDWRQQCDCPLHEPIPQTVLDPFAGSGTTGAVAVKHGRRAILFDLNTKYIDLQFERTNGIQMVMVA